MDQNTASMAKKLWKIVRVVYFMLRKGMNPKGKLLADLNMMMKRGKLAGKAAIHSLIFHHHHHGRRAVSFPAASLDEYEFSCRDSPNFRLPFHLSKRKHSHHAPPPPLDAEAMAAALEIFSSAAASPALPGFGPSPLVRQLRITDSPFPLRDGEEDNHVDEAAEEFIARFYNDLKSQNSKNLLGYY